MQYSQDFAIITKESLKRVTIGQPSILLMKNPTVVSPTQARSLQMSTFCDCYLQRRSTSRLKVLWKNLWRGIVRWDKGQLGRNQPDITPITVSRSRRPIRAHFRLHFEGMLAADISNNLIEKETKEYSFPIIYRSQSQSTHCKTKHKTNKLCQRTLHMFVVFLTIFSLTFWPAKWLKRNVSMFCTGKQKFACRRVVSPFQQRLKVTCKILELFHSRTPKMEFLLYQFST